jgi:aminoglycoside phosphotransferase (APT) family kinase protein
VPIDEALARRLVDGAFPDWRGLPLRAFASAGTDNVMLRLGEDKVLRLPRTPGAARALAREVAWMPRLGPSPITAAPTRPSPPSPAVRSTESSPTGPEPSPSPPVIPTTCTTVLVLAA